MSDFGEKSLKTPKCLSGTIFFSFLLSKFDPQVNILNSSDLCSLPSIPRAPPQIPTDFMCVSRPSEEAHCLDRLQLYCTYRRKSEELLWCTHCYYCCYLIPSGDEAGEGFTKKKKKKNLEKNSSHELIKTSAKTSKALLIKRLKVWSEVFVIWWAGEERITEHFDPANEIKLDNK